MRTALLLIIFATVTGCFQTENSSTLDGDTYGDVGGSAEFVAARTIFQQSCAGCHQFHTQSEAQLKTEGLLIAGNPESSKLYYRLSGSAGSSGPKNMPSGTTLNSSEIQQIRYWILHASP